MPVWLWVHALGVEAKVLSQRMHKRSLVALHWLESETLRFRISSEYPQLLLLRSGPSRILLIHVQGVGRIWDMIGLMLGIHIKGQSQLVVSLQACTLFVTLQCLLGVAISVLRRRTLGFLLDPLTIARNENLVLAGFVFPADRREVTW